MYAAVSPAGQIAFRYDYRLHGRRETLTFGKYGPDGLSLAEARERCMIARKLVAEGKSPALEKQREKRRVWAMPMIAQEPPLACQLVPSRRSTSRRATVAAVQIRVG